MKKKILIVTERRADYSKFRPILREIQKSKKLDYYLVVTGSHLFKEYGLTINEIKKDGFKISKKFSMYQNIKDDSGAKMTLALSKAIFHLTKIVHLQPYSLIVLPEFPTFLYRIFHRVSLFYFG